jgi:hypothetical protein
MLDIVVGGIIVITGLRFFGLEGFLFGIDFCQSLLFGEEPAVPSREVRRLRGQSCPRLIWSARQPAILSRNAEGNRS